MGLDQFQHSEAFCVMKYDYSQRPNKFGPKEEPKPSNPIWIWNSRDGVTPFVSVDGRTHADWGTDCRHFDLNDALVNHPSLSHVFTDMDDEMALVAAKRNIEVWSQGEGGWQGPKAELLAQEYVGGPTCVTLEEYRAIGGP